MKIHEQLGLERPIRGEVGIEVEVEGNNLAQRLGKYWRSVGDGSLRGESMEYVLAQPVVRDNVQKVLEYLREGLENSEVVPSNRCGVHVHINCQELELSDVISFITTYLCFEEVLVKWCGEDRVGNLFCLRASDAPGMLRFVRRLIDRERVEVLQTDRVRYGALNLKALPTYGSLEFRSMRSDLTPGVIEEWAGMLLALKDYSVGKAPSEVISQFSLNGPQDFFNSVLGQYRNQLQPNTQDLMTGMRNAQEVAFHG